MILAGVSIAMLTGDNGILTQAQNSKTTSEKAEMEEQIKLALTYARMNDKNDLSIDTEMLETELKANLGETGLDIQKQADGGLPWTVKKGDYTFTITEEGKVLSGTTNPGDDEDDDDEEEDTFETNPLGAMPTGATVIEADESKGIVIKDSNKNEWVWVEVPKSIYKNKSYNGGTAPKNSEDYTKIEEVMQAYATDYRGSYTDTFYSPEQHGFEDATEYNNWKNAMLKSVYENGGFWVGRYEVGAETSVTANDNAARTPLIQQNKYPYNYVTCSQAQTLSKQLATGGKTSSLMFGIQWDLVLKFMEEKGYLSDGTKKVTTTMLNSDSGDWGNYINKAFKVTRGKYRVQGDEGFESWKNASNYSKASSDVVLLTTGATERNSILNIYDLAGNVCEFTLESTSINSFPCVWRGGTCAVGPSSSWYASKEFVCDATGGGECLGFRPALY